MKNTILILTIISSALSYAETLIKPIDLENKILLKEKKVYHFNSLSDLSFNKNNKDDMFIHDQIKNILIFCGNRLNNEEFYSKEVFVNPPKQEKDLICKSIISEPLNIECETEQIKNYGLNENYPHQDELLYTTNELLKRKSNNFTGMISCSLNKTLKEKTKYRMQKQVRYKIKENNPVIEPYNYTLKNGSLIQGFGSFVTLVPNTNLINEINKNLIIKKPL